METKRIDYVNNYKRQNYKRVALELKKAEYQTLSEIAESRNTTVINLIKECIRKEFDFVSVQDLSDIKEINDEESNLVTVTKYCEDHKINKQAVLRRIQRKSLPAAVKIGRQWFVPKDLVLTDNRFK